MREILPDVGRWRSEGKQIALATVVRVYGSGPRPLGSKMAISSAGEMSGSVSGGCVEGAVVEEALEVLKTRRPKLLEYGIADETAFNIGLACGGTIHIFVEPLEEQPHSAAAQPAIFDTLTQAIEQEKLIALATVLSGPHLGGRLLLRPDGSSLGSLGSESFNAQVQNQTRKLLQTLNSERLTFEVEGEPAEVFIDIFPPPPRLVIIGAVHIAIPLVRFANILHLHTIVIDPRTAFANRDRFPHADELIVKWPDEALRELTIHEATYIVTLSHDEKLDNPALSAAVRSTARYIGALGSRKTHAKRVAALKADGLSDEELARIHSPVGLDIGARGAEEIALAIIAQIIAVDHGID